MLISIVYDSGYGHTAQFRRGQDSSSALAGGQETEMTRRVQMR